MCGILGYIGKDNNLNFEKALTSIEHRGPDAFGIYKSVASSGLNVLFGHRRLSILDTSHGSDQPFLSKDGRYILIFNGEIYNYRALREILKKNGEEFTTSGDTEVLLKWMISFGVDGVSSLDGMFAFAFYDKQEEILVIVRDKIGIKPIYFNLSDQTLYFCSELKGIFSLNPKLRTINPDLIAEYLLNGFIYEPETGFLNVHKIKPGNYFKWDLKNNQQDEVQYWLGTSKNSNQNSINVDNLLDQVIEEHTNCDVPVGLFFSGGVDSSIILTSLKNDIPCVTVASKDEEYKNAGFVNDYSYAKKITKYLNKKLKVVNLEDNINNVDDFLSAIDQCAIGNEELISDFTYISSYYISQAAANDGFKVMLSGMGADEIFAGYPRYQLLISRKLISFIYPFLNFFLKYSKTFSKKIGRLKSFCTEKSFELAYTSLVGVFSTNDVESLIGNTQGIQRFENKLNHLLVPVENESELRKALFLDLYGFLSHNFSVADKSSMKASIELRVPLATSKLVEIANAFNTSKHIDFFSRKKMLTKRLLKFLPREFVFRKKVGFNPPLDNYINMIGQEKLVRLLVDDIYVSKFLNSTFILNEIKDHFTQKKNNTYKLYQLLHLRSWLKLNTFI